MKPYRVLQVKHGQWNSIIFPQNILFWKFWLIIRPSRCWQQDSLLLKGPGISPQIHLKLHVLQFLFVRASNKKRRRGRIFSNFTKGETFHLLWQPRAPGVTTSLGNFSTFSLFCIEWIYALKCRFKCFFWYT